MDVKLVSIDSVKPYENNPRINDAAVESVAASLREFGFRQPIVVDADMVIIVGHTRWKAAAKLGLKKVPVHVAKDLTPAQIKAYRIADNQTATLAEWNMDLLPIELKDLQGMDFNLDLLGFSAEDLSAMLAPEGTAGLTDPDEAPALPDAATTKRGDLIIMGNHRLLCGDSSSEADVDRLLDGARIQLVNTDPPYNVKVEPRSNNAIAAGMSSFGEPGLLHHQGFDLHRMEAKKTRSKHHGRDVATGAQSGIATHDKLRAKDRPLANDFVSDEEFDKMLYAWFGNIARVLEPGGSFYIWGGYANLGNYPPVLKGCELYFSQGIVWDKMWPVLTRKSFLGCYEICFYGWREGGAHRFFGPNNATDLWHIKKDNPQDYVHLTQKPVELATRAIEYSSRRGENVLDLFGGSGSTLIGCEQTGRRAYLMELDPLYCDVIVQRWEQFTGKKAERITASDVGPENTPALVEAGAEGGAA
ncbi:MAG: hypothetical protein BIFFINMI_02816 [Phycisphaerae bacterium]|nr:hypothetical protein [Phycisphaerae bacterium]